MIRIIVVVALSVTFVTPASAIDLFKKSVSEDRVYTLYRNSVIGKDKRYHVATFDADEKEDYNRGNCEIAQELFQKQPGVTVKYWCEKSYFRE